MKNYNYAKIVDGNVIIAEEPLKIGATREIINPKKEHYLQAGYVEVLKTAMPQKDGYYYTSKIENVNGVPKQIWVENKLGEVENETAV